MRIELIQPTSKESVVASFAKKIGNSPYHICYETQNINQSIEKLTEDGYVLIHQPEKAIAIRNKKVAFLMSGEIGIIELVEF